MKELVNKSNIKLTRNNGEDEIPLRCHVLPFSYWYLSYLSLYLYFHLCFTIISCDNPGSADDNFKMYSENYECSICLFTHIYHDCFRKTVL
jgi:hypothetical protein